MMAAERTEFNHVTSGPAWFPTDLLLRDRAIQDADAGTLFQTS